MTGVNRNIQQKALLSLQYFPALVILGARQTGKTTLSQSLGSGWLYLDLENPQDFERFTYDPGFFFETNPHSVIFDEAQVCPELFAYLRGVIDRKRDQKGRFILTGSSSPQLMTEISESLAGRVAIIELSPLKANEIYSKPQSSFYQLFSKTLSRENLPKGPAPLSQDEMLSTWFHGGYPEPCLSQDPLFYDQWMQNYRETYVNRDLSLLFPKLDKFAYQRFLSILGKLSGSIINKSHLARAIEMSEGTIRDYIKIAEGTFLWRNLPNFDKNPIKSMVKMPKGYVRDSGLLHSLNQIPSLDSLMKTPLVGSSFESFVTEEILRGLQATLVTNWSAYYYRTRNGAEIDLILDGSFGMLPIEIKYGSHVRPKELITLQRFIDEYDLPFGLVINQSKSIDYITNKIIQMPVGWL